MLRLPRCMKRKSEPIPACRATPPLRITSPSGGSTLTTSAPYPARMWVAHGPITTVERSRILIPASGPGRGATGGPSFALMASRSSTRGRGASTGR